MNCVWKQDWAGIWDTGCGHAFEFTTDTPRDNKFKYCCYCGKPLEQAEYQEGSENE